MSYFESTFHTKLGCYSIAVPILLEKGKYRLEWDDLAVTGFHVWDDDLKTHACGEVVSEAVGMKLADAILGEIRSHTTRAHDVIRSAEDQLATLTPERSYT